MSLAVLILAIKSETLKHGNHFILMIWTYHYSFSRGYIQADINTVYEWIITERNTAKTCKKPDIFAEVRILKGIVCIQKPLKLIMDHYWNKDRKDGRFKLTPSFFLLMSGFIYHSILTFRSQNI
jgi:hypothetical protein